MTRPAAASAWLTPDPDPVAPAQPTPQRAAAQRPTPHQPASLGVIPDLTPVKSSNVAAIGHDGQALYVRFQSGGVYRYDGIPRELHDQMAAAASPGSFFHATIRHTRKAERVG